MEAEVNFKNSLAWTQFCHQHHPIHLSESTYLILFYLPQNVLVRLIEYLDWVIVKSYCWNEKVFCFCMFVRERLFMLAHNLLSMSVEVLAVCAQCFCRGHVVFTEHVCCVCVLAAEFLWLAESLRSPRTSRHPPTLHHQPLTAGKRLLSSCLYQLLQPNLCNWAFVY